LGRKPFVDRELAAGTLVEVGAESIAAETAYWLVSSEASDRRPDLRSFKRWLIEETRAG
jgi:DNA-binding transcriptional LysR family regulator